MSGTKHNDHRREWRGILLAAEAKSAFDESYLRRERQNDVVKPFGIGASGNEIYSKFRFFSPSQPIADSRAIRRIAEDSCPTPLLTEQRRESVAIAVQRARIEGEMEFFIQSGVNLFRC